MRLWGLDSGRRRVFSVLRMLGDDIRQRRASGCLAAVPWPGGS
jgi:hypothetical protein